MKKASAYEVFLGPTNRVVTLKLIRYSLYMILIPLAVFYFLYIVIFKQNQDMLGWCGIAAVIATNCVIASYVIMAWNEPDDGANKKLKIKSVQPQKTD
eukprot:gene4959-6934_t